MKAKPVIPLIGLFALAIASASPAQRFTCLMHPEVVQDRPGHCPKCGMTLVPNREGPKKETDHLIDHGTHRPSATRSGETHEMTMAMQSTIDLADPMSRESSGTAWVPDSTSPFHVTRTPARAAATTGSTRPIGRWQCSHIR